MEITRPPDKLRPKPTKDIIQKLKQEREKLLKQVATLNKRLKKEQIKKVEQKIARLERENKRMLENFGIDARYC